MSSAEPASESTAPPNGQATEMELRIKLHINQHRQGPGGNAATLLAARLAGLNRSEPLKIADIGCGTGASAVLLAQEFPKCTVVALDALPEFVDVLKERAEKEGVADKISVVVGKMEELPFAEDSLDVVWSEGSVYNIGFERGVREWRRYLKRGGKLALSELTWLSEERPEEITRHWENEYKEISTAGTKIAQIERHGYKVLGYFTLDKDSWMKGYYEPLANRLKTFVAENAEHQEAATRIVEEHNREIALYEKYSEFVSYGFYVAEKMPLHSDRYS